MARQLAVCGEGRMKMLTLGNNLLNKHIVTPYRHNAASVVPIKGLRPHSVFLNPAVLYAEKNWDTGKMPVSKVSIFISRFLMY